MGITVSIILLIGIAIWQYIEYRKTQKVRESFHNIFPTDPNTVLRSVFDEEKNALQIRWQVSAKYSEIFRGIVKDINHYLEKNTGSTDFAILKDITDRHSDAVEEQIQTTSPFPIYIGLCGTLIGIVFGVCVLGFGGGLEALLSTEEEITVTKGAEGIADLLRGVGVAMLTTLFGVSLTISGSRKYKNANTENERRKNLFWLKRQKRLLKALSDKNGC